MTATTSERQRAFLPPDIDGERCVHALSPSATCTACVTACPRAALHLGDEALTIDTHACDGCGRCAAACPQQAISQPDGAAPYVPRGNPRLAFAACEVACDSGERGRVPCLDMLGLAALADMYSAGVRQLAVAAVECKYCPRARRPTLADHVADLAHLLADRGLEPLELTPLSPSGWSALRDEAGRLSRRSLFRAAVAAAPSPAPQSSSGRAPGAVLPLAAAAKIVSVAPAIDPAACTACGACVRVCPHQVIAVAISADGRPAYTFDPVECSGCGLCVDVCDPHAIELEHYTGAIRPPLPLDRDQCATCGNAFLRVSGHSPATTDCRVCRTRSPRQKLFQVQP